MNYPEDFINKIICGDCLEVMKGIPDGSIDLIVTSPPYDNLRDYHGYSFDFTKTSGQLYRVIKQGGVLVWVIGDTTKKFCESMSSFNQAIHFKSLGFNLLDTMIYVKSNYAPAYPFLRRYANQFEYMFVFSKGKPKTFNPIQKPKARNKNEKHSFRQVDGSLKVKYTKKGRDTKDASNVWEYPVGGNLTGHPGVFPEQLAVDHIMSWSLCDDVVLDPMVGSGTTCLASKKLGRNYIGIDVSPEYCEIARNRIGTGS